MILILCGCFVTIVVFGELLLAIYHILCMVHLCACVAVANI
jgi:hypothetical protein